MKNELMFVVMFSLLLIGCVEFRCSGLAVGDDIVITARHCAPDVKTVHAAHEDRSAVAVGDQVTIIGYGCNDPRQERVARQRMGTVLSLDENQAILSTTACPGDSGAPAFDIDGKVIGIVVESVVKQGFTVYGSAVIELF